MEIIQDKKAAVSYNINNAMIKKHRTSLFYFCTRYIFISLTVKWMNDSVIARSGQYDAVWVSKVLILAIAFAFSDS